MKRSIEAYLTLGILVASFGCSPPATSGDGDSGTESGDGDSTTNTGDGDGDTGTGGSGPDAVGTQLKLSDARVTCETSQIGTPLLRRLTQSETLLSLRDIFGLSNQELPSTRLSPDPLSRLGFTNDAAVLAVGGNTAKELLKTGEDLGDLVVERLNSILPCSATAADRGCVEQYLASYGMRLFRRPLTVEETARYADYHASVSARSNFATGIKWMTVALVESPHAFYRSEIGQKSGTDWVLDDYELASEMSYMLSGSTPDAELLQAAASGQLSDPVGRKTQAQRLLGEGYPRRLDGISGFFVEWLKYRTVKGQSRVDAAEFAGTISNAMADETQSFLSHLVFGVKGTVRDLMTADFSAHNAALSSFYGWGAAASDAFEVVERPANQGMGILSQGSLLASTAHQSETSPTLRGLMFTTHFLCMDKPLPPAVVPTIESTNVGKETNTTREKYELNHRADATCNNCHAKFEPFGYVFEGFDETGRARTVEKTDKGEFPIDTVVDDAKMPDGTLKPFNSLDELALLVDQTDDVENCISGLLASYMFSGAGGTQCLAEEARAQVASGQMSIHDYLLALVETEHFTKRRTK